VIELATTVDTPALPEPQAGGTYRRNADGSLTLIEQSQQTGADEAASIAPVAQSAAQPDAPPAVAEAPAPAQDTQDHQE
jgi:hypothetical protein